MTAPIPKDRAFVLSENDMDVIEGMGGHGDEWMRPMDFGGMNASHHSATATRLCARGLVERTDHLGGSLSGRRKTWRYRLTAAGMEAFRAMRSL